MRVNLTVKRVWVTKDRRYTIRIRFYQQFWFVFSIGKPKPYCLAWKHRLNKAAYALFIVDLKVIAIGIINYDIKKAL